ncbi:MULTISPECIES: F0F1 ATP synthase subunit epsilon [unclassified Actinobaculum]|uniref:F0F1 ATP synthase subunit epsilon n=1 Tax=unclassified Actinobaculum TaxID=2609299 RepID=UPI000D526D51|nr:MULTISPECIES: F0F1 ATP synthase subunit epsilon [unclassified Actinobaculum]AWE42884.1 hypothetical protein DDD63_09185 [Actinobaculum sp. 313]RTE49032.1 F0F1 ATP synthase subunit epsilon [Actinobaculum sp. 352]
MLVEIVARSGPVWSGRADHVSVPSVNGAMGILPGHTPLMALLDAGPVEVRQGDGTVEVFDVDRGFVTVDSDHVYIVADGAGNGAARRGVAE